jgi:APA family basic amino acid/polyamine antiporter
MAALPPSPPPPPGGLKRTVTLPMLTFYGIGTVVGAGIYVLLGAIVDVAGGWAPISFALAAAMAGFSAFSFAELSSRLPRSAGTALYVWEGTRSRGLSTAVGLLSAAAGTITCATLVTGFAAHVHEWLAIPTWIATISVAIALGMVVAWGIAETMVVAVLLTVLEVGGLLLVVVVALPDAITAPQPLPPLTDLVSAHAWSGIFAATLLAFFAFIGFEDMVNVAEEVVHSSRTMPRAILLTLAVTLALYASVSLVVALAVPRDIVAASPTPLATVFAHVSGWSATPVIVIAVVALLNGALVQIVMASRILYGMASLGHLPGWLGRIHPARRTPLSATVLVTVVVLGLALAVPLVTLAKLSSLAILVIFTLVNLSLLLIKRRYPDPGGADVYPAWVPAAGLVVSAVFAATQIGAFVRALDPA